MCGVPYHSADNYIAKLIRKGFKVAICEQMEDPRLAKTLVHREVTRVLTPGTAADAHLDSEENNFLACVARAGNASRICRTRSLDWRVSRHRVSSATTPSAAFGRSCCSLRPREMLFASSLPLFGCSPDHDMRRKLRPRPAHRINRERQLGGDAAR